MVGSEKFVGLLNYLRVGVEDVNVLSQWASLLLEIIQTPEGAQHLAIQSWEVLVELAISGAGIWGSEDFIYDPQVTDILLGAQEWDKLECWVGVIWVLWPPETDNTQGDLVRAMVSLLRRRPGAAQKVAGWMIRFSGESRGDVPTSFLQVLRAFVAAETYQSYVPFRTIQIYSKTNMAFGPVLGRVRYRKERVNVLLTRRQLLSSYHTEVRGSGSCHR